MNLKNCDGAKAVGSVIQRALDGVSLEGAIANPRDFADQHLCWKCTDSYQPHGIWNTENPH